MKMSVIMIDGGFRENPFGEKYFTKQNFPQSDYEVIWVEYYDKPHPAVIKNSKIKVITLCSKGIYHSSYCFNKGIIEARGKIIIIPDADQIVKPNFLSKVWKIHSKYDKLVVYGYRYDESNKGLLASHDFDELEKKCQLKNTVNYGGCLTVHKKWLLRVNGYEQHPIFQTGNHANGLDIYTRFKNIGLAIQWEPELKLYHPWHHFTLMYTKEQVVQKKLIEWRKENMQWMAFEGIDSSKNFPVPTEISKLIKSELVKLDENSRSVFGKFAKKLIRSFKKIICRTNRVFH